MDVATRTTSDPRPLTCAQCGSTFACGLGGDCWCADEAFRLPVPAAGAADCLCPACLRTAAAQQAPAPQG
jgi:hypothetical protein